MNTSDQKVNKPVTCELIDKAVSDLFYTEQEKDPNWEQFQKTLNFIAQFETLEDLPHGCYNFGNFMTGRGGAIDFMKTFDKQMKEIANAKLSEIADEELSIPEIGIQLLDDDAERD